LILRTPRLARPSLMTKAPLLDPFAVFGVEHRLDLEEHALERRYLQLSRELHPDRNRAIGAADCAAVLLRAAEVNDAWRVLRDPWERARALSHILAPGILEQHKSLDPDFLLDAIDLAEQVTLCEPNAVANLQGRIKQQADAIFATLQKAFAAGDHALAAQQIHQSKYLRKALADLETRS
ncbi:MAG: Fe-S protein assembly co-chaperone HscB, partial [Planctomycetota bacterium]